jgi:hypothetical protein
VEQGREVLHGEGRSLTQTDAAVQRGAATGELVYAAAADGDDNVDQQFLV